MRKTRRKIPCRCGSGRDYERCCLPGNRERLLEWLAADDLERQFPDQIVWLQPAAMAYEALGETEKAIGYYRRCLAAVTATPEYGDDEADNWYRDKLAELEAPN